MTTAASHVVTVVAGPQRTPVRAYFLRGWRRARIEAVYLAAAEREVTRRARPRTLEAIGLTGEDQPT